MFQSYSISCLNYILLIHYKISTISKVGYIIIFLIFTNQPRTLVRENKEMSAFNISRRESNF